MTRLKKNTVYYACGSGATAAISLISLPLTTLFLNPLHFGEFALISAILAATHGMFTSAVGYFINSHYRQSDVARRARVVSSILIASTLMSTVAAPTAFILFETVLGNIGGFYLPNVLYGVLAASLIPLGLWTSASQMMMLDERALLFAVGTIINPLVAAVVTIALISTTHLRTEAMVIGATAGNILTGVFCVPWIFKRAAIGMSKDGLRSIFRLVPTAFSGNGLEASLVPIERTLLAAVSGPHILGLYAHSQTYPQTIFRLTKSIALSTFPLSLREATEATPTFVQTKRIWSATHYVLGVITLGFIFFGESFIALLTHGKFIDAHPFACMLLVAMMFRYLGRPAIAFLYAQAESLLISRINLVSSAIGMLVLVILVPALSRYSDIAAAYGAIGAIGARYVASRIGFLIYAGSIGQEEDRLLLKGVATSVVAFLTYTFLVERGLLYSAIYFSLFLVFWTYIARASLPVLLSVVRFSRTRGA